VLLPEPLSPTLGFFTFLGQNLMALGSLLRGRAQFRWADAFLVMEQTGPQALGIVAMINFLVGLILAFVGSLELARFGASIFVADQVGIATVREMGCIMTGIILCGRTGAAFAAQLGTMKVNEEINALQTWPGPARRPASHRYHLERPDRGFQSGVGTSAP
jgi:phospholipid/cholesterol/gamma-HCH transport system permease protein